MAQPLFQRPGTIADGPDEAEALLVFKSHTRL